MTYLENYLEGLHIAYVHPGLARAIDLRAYRYEAFPGGLAQVAPARRGEAALPWAEGEPLAALYLAFFPGTLLNFYPWGLSLNVLLPVAPGRCEVRYRRFVVDGAGPAGGAGADLDQVEREDQEVVERVALGLRARRAPRSRYAPGHEDGLRHFHQWLRAQIEGTSAP
jgi:choline monooxygenase